MRLVRRRALGLGLGLSCLLFVGAAGQDEDPAADAVQALDLASGLAHMAQLTEREEFDAARAQGEALLAPNLFAAWHRVIERDLEDSRLLGPALSLADPVIDLLRLNGSTMAERAHVHYAMGVVELSAGEAEASKREFEAARALSGPGELRLDASYNLATVCLLQGEAWRAQIPELGGQPPQAAPQAPPAPGAPPAQPAEPPDPLEEARARYLEALGHFKTRLELDWRSPDVRANTELVLRRLRELDEIERQREEQQQEQENQDQEQQDQDKQDQDPQDQDQQDPQDQENQDEQQNSEQEQEQESQSEEEQEQEQPEEQEGEEPQSPEEAQPEESEATPEEQRGQEIYLTKEEAQRLFDKLKRHEEQGEEVEARTRSQRHRPTARDW